MHARPTSLSKAVRLDHQALAQQEAVSGFAEPTLHTHAIGQGTHMDLQALAAPWQGGALLHDRRVPCLE
jgi:hypothetical protein